MSISSIKEDDYSFLLTQICNCDLKKLFPEQKDLASKLKKFMQELDSKYDHFTKLYRCYCQLVIIQNSTLYWCKYIDILVHFLASLGNNNTHPFWNDRDRQTKMVDTLKFLTTMFRVTELISMYGLASNDLNIQFFLEWFQHWKRYLCLLIGGLMRPLEHTVSTI